MTTNDLPLAMRLTTQAGWNQREADWRRFLAMQPDGCFVAEHDGVAVATTVACVFDRVAWLAMVLVDAANRGRGIGTALVRHALAFLDRTGVCAVRLDATSLGRPIYAKLGFELEYELGRYEGVLPSNDSGPPTQIQPQIQVAGSADYARLCDFDGAVVGADRSKYLRRLFQEQPDELRWTGNSSQVTGYATVRLGSNALQLGPCVANSDVGRILLSDMVQRHAGERVVIDVPLCHAPALRFAGSLGLELRRNLSRMRRGPTVAEETNKIWASSGPELG